MQVTQDDSKDQHVYEYEYTDTFGGEANYAWCKRGRVYFDSPPSQHQLTSAVKKELSLTGVRCKIADIGELTLVPYGSPTIVFIHSIV